MNTMGSALIPRLNITEAIDAVLIRSSAGWFTSSAMACMGSRWISGRPDRSRPTWRPTRICSPRPLARIFELRNEPLAQLVHVVAAVVVVKRVHLVSGCVEVADVVQGHLGGPEEVRPFRKFVDLVLPNLPYHPLLLAPAERPSPPALGARARRAVGRRRGRGSLAAARISTRLSASSSGASLKSAGLDCDRRMGREPGTTSSKHSCEGATSGNPATPPESAPVHVAADRAEVERADHRRGRPVPQPRSGKRPQP